MSIVKEKVTIKDACALWVSQFNDFPLEMIQKLFCIEMEDWQEVTPILEGTRVFSNKFQHSGTVIKVKKYGEKKYSYLIELDNGEEKESFDSDLCIERESFFPMWGTMWQFRDVCDDRWIAEEENQRKMAECGFRIYESEEFGYFFGIDGAGYDFYQVHWIPLYKERGLQWHTTE